MLDTQEILKAFSAIIAAVSLGISVLSFFTIYKLKQIPLEKRNLLEYQNPKKYTNLGFISLAISILFGALAFIILKSSRR